MTPACKVLKLKKIDYTLHEYQHDKNVKNFGLEAVEKLGLKDTEVFKTLLVTDENQFFVMVIPVNHKLNLKKAAAVVDAKKLKMADPKEAERVTGYLVGGISPIGQKKQFITAIDRSAQSLETMYISGGKRGLDIGIHPQDLQMVLNAQFADLLNE